MTKQEFRELLWENGYKPYEPSKDEMEYGEGWWYERKGWMHKQFDETDVAFETREKGNVWLSVILQDARLEWAVKNIVTVNMLLAAFGAEPLKYKNDERVD